MQRQTAPNRLRELRKMHDLKLFEVAALVDRDQSMLHRYESGEVNVPDEVKLRLAARYECSVEYLMGWDAADGEAA